MGILMDYSKKAQIERLKDSLFSDKAKEDLEIFSRCWHKVLCYHHQNEDKANAWFMTRNYLLGDMTPMEMFKRGYADKLEDFIKAWID